MNRDRSPRGAAPSLLRAGPLDMVFEEGRLHSIATAGIEVWRSVMFLYRDPAWATPWHALSDLVIEADDDRFALRFHGWLPHDPGIEWSAAIEGSAAGQVRFDVELLPTRDVLASRAGLCLLHPLSAAGCSLEVEHADGRVSRSRFPALVSPWQPFTQIRALRHAFAPGCWATCRMEGDVFEMEDQRNFSDASFKTYSRSNLMPRPYRLAANERLRQSMLLTIEGAPRSSPRRRASQVTVEVAADTCGRLPALGLLGGQAPALTAPRSDFLHVRLDLRGLPATDFAERIGASMRAAIPPHPGVPVRYDLLLGDELLAAEACRALHGVLHEAGGEADQVAVFPTTARSIDAVRAQFPAVRAGGGTAFFFTQLNRIEALPPVDFITFSTSPIVHVADDLSVMQSLATLPVLVQTLRARGLVAPLHVGPVGIAMSLDPFDARVAAAADCHLPMATVDLRDQADFGTAWAFGYLCRMAAAGVQALSFQHARTVARLAPLTALDRPALRALRVTAPEQVAAIAVQTPAGVETWLGNLTGASLSVRLSVHGQRPRTVQLDAFALRRDGGPR